MTKTMTVSAPSEIKKGFSFTRKSDPSKLPELLSKLEEAVATLNTVVNDDDVSAIREANDAATSALEAYNQHKTLCDYEDLIETSDPMKSALAKGYILLKRVTTENSLGVVNYNIEDTEVQIDFPAFSNIAGKLMGAKTQLFASQLGYMVLIAKGVADGNSAAAITTAYQKAKNKPIMKVLTKAPSKNELKAALQDLLDSIYFEDNGSGKNKFMVTSEWLHWFTDAINRAYYGKGYLTRSAKSVKQIIQHACSLYHAYYNKYGVSTSVDKDNVVVGAPIAEGEQEKPKAKKPKTKKSTEAVA